MSVVTITAALGFELVPGSGSWTDMSSYLLQDSGIKFSRGVGADRKMRASGMSFSLDNSSEDLSIGNTSSTFFNKLRKGIGVRFSWTYSGTTKYEFRGFVTTIKPRYVQYGRARNRVEFQCEGQTSALRAYEKYGMALQANTDADDAIAAIMTAVGSTLYSLTDSALTLPYVFPRGDALTDIVAVAAGDPGMLLFEDGQGRVRLTSMVGGNHNSPTHTWAAGGIEPVGDVSPDYRNDSQFGRVAVSVSSFQPSSEVGVLYRHKLNWETGFSEPIPAYTGKVIKGEFEAMPNSVVTKFTQSIVEFTNTNDSLGVAMDAVTTTLVTSSQIYAPTTFRVDDEIRIDQEIVKVTALISANNNQQRLTVTRAQRSTVAVAHAIALPAGTRLYRRGLMEILTPVDPGLTVSATLAAGIVGNPVPSTTLRLFNGATLVSGDLIKIGTEVILIQSSAGAPTSTYTVARAQAGTTVKSHATGAVAQRYTVQAPADSLGYSYIRGSEFASGIPADSADITGAGTFPGAQDILVVGNKFQARVYNNDAATRYLADLVIGGTMFKANEQTATITLEKAIPNILGIPVGPGGNMPFGAQSLNVAKTYALGLLRAGRVPTPWLTVTFTANASAATAADMLTAEVGDLVRYTGTGTYSERIDEFYRIIGISGEFEVGNDQLSLTFNLAPSHLWRNPVQGWYSDFSVAQIGTVNGSLGVFEVSPAGGAWSNVGNNWGGVSYNDGSGFLAVGLGPKTTNPSPCVVNVGSADMSVGAHVNTGTVTWPATTGGIGVTFRANSSTPTTFWEARFNPTHSKVYLWNTTDGLVTGGDVAWTPTASPEIEVRCQGNRIRVYVDCAAEPVIDVTSTRFNTQTYAGPAFEATTITVTPVWRDFTAHGL